MSKREMNLQLFGMSNGETTDSIKDIRRNMNQNMEFWHDWEFAAAGAFQAAKALKRMYLKS